MVPEVGIAECLALDDEAAAGKLIERAMAAGGVDNVSIILVSVTAAA